MKKVTFKVSDELVSQIDECCARWGFATRSEFFRHASIEFLHHVAQAIPTNEVLKENTKAIKQVNLRRPHYNPYRFV